VTRWLQILLIPPLLAGPIAAQKVRKPDRPHRSGLWLEVGAGPAGIRMACSNCTDVIAGPGSGGYSRLGWIISDKVIMAWESVGISDESFGFVPTDSMVADLAATGIVVLWYPWKSGAFLKGGVGIGAGSFTVPSPTPAARPDTIDAGGVGMTFGVGWDFALSRKYAITVNAAAFVMAIGDVVLPSGPVDDVIGTMYQVTLGFTFR
jgi:hypothetical protein